MFIIGRQILIRGRRSPHNCSYSAGSRALWRASASSEAVVATTPASIRGAMRRETSAICILAAALVSIRYRAVCALSGRDIPIGQPAGGVQRAHPGTPGRVARLPVRVGGHHCAGVDRGRRLTLIVKGATGIRFGTEQSLLSQHREPVVARHAQDEAEPTFTAEASRRSVSYRAG